MRENLAIAELLRTFVKALVEIAEKNIQTLMPGFTHLQHAQPISLAEHLLAYAFMFKRDFERFISSYERNNFRR